MNQRILALATGSIKLTNFWVKDCRSSREDWQFHSGYCKFGWGRSPGGGNGNPTPVFFLPGESHAQRRLAGYSSQGRKESDTTKHPCPL